MVIGFKVEENALLFFLQSADYTNKSIEAKLDLIFFPVLIDAATQYMPINA